MTIIEAVTPKAKRAGRGVTPPEVYAFFVEQCRANLHMVLAMSPVGDALRFGCLHAISPIHAAVCYCCVLQPLSCHFCHAIPTSILADSV